MFVYCATTEMRPLSSFPGVSSWEKFQCRHCTLCNKCCHERQIGSFVQQGYTATITIQIHLMDKIPCARHCWYGFQLIQIISCGKVYMLASSSPTFSGHFFIPWPIVILHPASLLMSTSMEHDGSLLTESRLALLDQEKLCQSSPGRVRRTGNPH